MEQHDVVARLTALAQLDIDAVEAYDQALESLAVPSIRARLVSFKADHERHINDLSAALRRLGAEPPERAPDFKGFLIEGYTAVRGAMGPGGALHAMKTNEMLTNATYRQALNADLPADLKRLVERNYEDEQRHLAYLDEAIRSEAWEDAVPAFRSAPTRVGVADVATAAALLVGGAFVVHGVLRPSVLNIVGAVFGGALALAPLAPRGYAAARSMISDERRGGAVAAAKEGWQMRHGSASVRSARQPSAVGV